MNNATIHGSAGNSSILDVHKTAFLCSRQVPAAAVLKCYDWAVRMRAEGRCVIGGFHSPLEQDVLYYLLQGKQPVIMVLARGMKAKWEPALQKALDEGRLLIVAPFGDAIKRASKDTAAVRNDLMVKLADEVVVGYANLGGMLQQQLQTAEANEKKVLFLV